MTGKHSDTHAHLVFNRVSGLACVLAVLFFCSITVVATPQKIIVLNVRIENDIGVENAGPITTRWLIDSIARTAPNVRVIPGEQAQSLARLKIPIDPDGLSPTVTGALIKSIGSTHILSGDIFLWNQKYGITLRLIDLSNVKPVRIERAWAENPKDIPSTIETVARLIFAPAKKTEPVSAPLGQPKVQKPKVEEKRDPPKVTALLKKHPEMVFVPGGEFVMGNNNDSDAYNMPVDPSRREGVSRLLLIAAEKPEHTVKVKPFLIDKYEVTNAEYKKFKPDHTFPQEKANHPVTGVSWFDARAYAAWAGKRLPTEEEWEKAARGTDARKWPWGNIFVGGYSNLGTDTSPVGSFENDKSPYGAYDMAGNVQEWTSSSFLAYPGNSSKDVAFDSKKKVVRGSYYGGNDFLARCSMRFCAFPGSLNIKPEGDNYTYIGFRCAIDID